MKIRKIKKQKIVKREKMKSGAQHGQQAENLCVLLFQHAKWVKEKLRKKII